MTKFCRWWRKATVTKQLRRGFVELPLSDFETGNVKSVIALYKSVDYPKGIALAFCPFCGASFKRRIL
jgi:hypothetical protein